MGWGFERSESCPSSSLSASRLCLKTCALSFHLAPPCLPLAALPPCHDRLFLLWSQNPKWTLSAINCLGVFISNRKVTNILGSISHPDLNLALFSEGVRNHKTSLRQNGVLYTDYTAASALPLSWFLLISFPQFSPFSPFFPFIEDRFFSFNIVSWLWLPLLLFLQILPFFPSYPYPPTFSH